MFAYQEPRVRFRKLNNIGLEGKNSEVFTIHDQNLNATLVIKEVVKNSGYYDPKYYEEAQIMYKSTHPNVVRVLYACEDDDKIYVATPYYSKGSLKSYMEHRHLTVREIIQFPCQFLNGLQNVHAKKLIHFDIKPDNILLSDRMEALLADFGQSKEIDENGLAVQPYQYSKILPPEYFGNPQYIFDQRTDIYQAGLTMYRMCVGDSAFNQQLQRFADMHQFGLALRKENFPDKNAYPLHIPRALQNVINKCLKANPIQRYQSAISVINALADIDGTILDWQYEITGDHRQVWFHESGGYIRKIVVCPANSSQAFKHKVDGNERRVTKFCKAKITDNEIIQFLTT